MHGLLMQCRGGYSDSGAVLSVVVRQFLSGALLTFGSETTMLILAPLACESCCRVGLPLDSWTGPSMSNHARRRTRQDGQCSS